MAKWLFQEHDGFRDIDQSSASEAFSGTSIRDLATALIREGVQNILDARSGRPDAGPLRLRLTLGTCPGGSEKINSRWFGDLMHHLRQPDVGAPDPPAADEACRYLAFEDFGTKGLVGDFGAPYKPGEENNFVNFMYHDGVSGKVDANLGSRGVGKIVFTMASRARTIFAYTIPESDPARKPLLVGKNLLKFRQVGGKLYTGRSYFLDAWPQGQARQPVSDSDEMGRFRTDFPITRKNEPGLSIIIPFIDPSIVPAELRRAIVEEYHFALLDGRLEIELIEGSGTEVFNSENVPAIEDDEVNAKVDLARWAVGQSAPELGTLAPDPNELQRLTEELVTAETREVVTKALNDRGRVAVRMPVYIHPKHSEPALTYFDVYLELADRHHSKPQFVRDLLPVSDVREARPAPQIRALVLVRAGPLADLLRAAEGANHTDWSPRTDRFQERYVSRRGEIAFVAQSVSRLVEIVRGQANEPVKGIASQFFSAAKPKSDRPPTDQGRDTPGADGEDTPVDLPSTPPSSYILTQNEDGFFLRHKPGQPLSSRLTVRVAYDVLRGSPWSGFDPDDFDFRKSKGDVRVIASGAEVERKEPGNRLVIVPQSEDFEIVATGFDPNRDLIVDVRDAARQKRQRKENNHADQKTELHKPQTANA